MSGPAKIVLVDDHPLFRDGVARTLAEESGAFEVVGTGGDAEAALRLVTEHKPHMCLLDISMPGGGIEAARAISGAAPEVAIVMLTASEEDGHVVEALKAGARGYVVKGVGGRELIEILHSILQGGAYVSPFLAARLLTEMRSQEDQPEHRLTSLTQREEQILRRVANGLSNKEIAREFDLQEKTVKHHMTSILNKLQVRNRVEAAIIAREHIKNLD